MNKCACIAHRDWLAECKATENVFVSTCVCDALIAADQDFFFAAASAAVVVVCRALRWFQLITVVTNSHSGWRQRQQHQHQWRAMFTGESDNIFAKRYRKSAWQLLLIGFIIAQFQINQKETKQKIKRRKKNINNSKHNETLYRSWWAATVAALLRKMFTYWRTAVRAYPHLN